MKIVLFDLETTPIITYSWGMGQYDRPAMLKKDWELLSFAWKELGKTVGCLTRAQRTERELVTNLHILLDNADVVIAHNATEFDMKKAAAKFIQFGLPPINPRVIDTLTIAKRHFKFTQNGLDALGIRLKVGRKKKTDGIELWDKCMAGNRKALAAMAKYNKQDVLLLERVYLKLRPWVTGQANISLMSGDGNGCPKCGSMRMHKNGVRTTSKMMYVRYRCQDCGGAAIGEVIKGKKGKYNAI